MQDSKSLHYVLGAALALIAVFVVVALVMINSQATDTNTTVTITNAAPVAEAIYLSNDAETGDGGQQVDDYGAGTIDSLVSGSTKSLYLTGYVSDTNGALDITGVIARLYRTTQTITCSADENDCYIDASCDTFAKADTQLYYSCGPFAVQYFADSTVDGGGYIGDNWTGSVIVTDGTLTDDITLNKEMGLLLSLDIPTAINYNTLALGAETTTENNQMMQLVQFGNDEADVNVSSAAAMVCTIDGTIPVGNQEWALTTDVNYGSGTDLTTSPVDTNAYVAYRTGASETKNLHWNIGIPTTGVAGVCTGTTVITAIAH